MIINETRSIRVGIRPSVLAHKQVYEVANLLPQWQFDIISIETEGDRDKSTPLVSQENSNFFTGDIEEALLRGEIDIAIHSAKDLEMHMPKDLIIAAMTRSISPYDTLVSRSKKTLHELPAGAVVGTSSKDRQEALKRVRSDLVIKDIRGNVDNRLEQLDAGDYDAIIVAHAALLRLGLEHRIAQIIPLSMIEPHPLQGRLAIQIRKDRADLKQIFEKCHAR